MIKAVGFTGTQILPDEWANRRLYSLLSFLLDQGYTELHHGDCVGADRLAHVTAVCVGMRVVLHPPTNDSKRAFCTADREWPPLPYLSRNKVIVDFCDEMIAMPRTSNEQLRSGTWATVRYARKRGKRITLIPARQHT